MPEDPEDPEDPEEEEEEEEEEPDESEDSEEEPEEEQPEEEEQQEEDEDEESSDDSVVDEQQEEESAEEEQEEEEEVEEQEQEELEEEEAALPEIDEDVFTARDAWEDASDEDFEDDAGDWSASDYHETATTLFGALDFFGDTAEQRWIDEGFSPLGEESSGILSSIAEHFGGTPSTFRVFERDGRIVPRGFLTTIGLELLESAFPDLDLSMLHVTVPRRPPPAPMPDGSVRPARDLPASIRNATPSDSVDLRKYATPIGDQGPTSRCAAFAWTHALEMLARMHGRDLPRLACSFTMYRFQQRQGDARDFKWAWKGGDGTSGTWEPGDHLFTSGTCRHDHWPNDEKHPRTSLEEMEADALMHRFEADVYDVTVEDMKKLLSSGLPVQISMSTGEAFSDVGRDGVVKVAEGPSGQHGYHAMLCVGYVGNYFIVKNSWGEDWGHGGYCYIPKKVLMDSEPEAVAIVPRRASGGAGPGPGPGGGGPGGPIRQSGQTRPPQNAAFAAPPVPRIPQQPPAPARVAAPAPAPAPARVTPAQVPGNTVACARCTKVVPAGKFCRECGAALPPPPAPASVRKFCSNCGTPRSGAGKFCAGCGAPHG